MEEEFLSGIKAQIALYKNLGEKAMMQVEEDDLFWKPNEESNSIAMIVKHLSGNMKSRWTNFRTEDGEKSWRNRDNEFYEDIESRVELMKCWEEGWQCFTEAIFSISNEELLKTIYIRKEAHSITKAIIRQISHYPYHVGQIVYLARMRSTQWNSLSIPRGASNKYNESKGM